MDYFFIYLKKKTNRKIHYGQQKKKYEEKLHLAVKENCKENLEQSKKKRKSNKLLDTKKIEENFLTPKFILP